MTAESVAGSEHDDEPVINVGTEQCQSCWADPGGPHDSTWCELIDGDENPCPTCGHPVPDHYAWSTECARPGDAMTDRIHSFTVALDQNIRDDDVQPIIDAIQMIKHVLSVTPHVADADAYMAESRAKTELRQKLWDVLK